MLTFFSFVEFETAADLKKAVEALDGREFKEARVTCVANVGIPHMLIVFLQDTHQITDPARHSGTWTISFAWSSPTIPSSR